MKALVIYGSTRGNTKTVVGRLAGMLKFHFDVQNVSDIDNVDVLQGYDLLLFFASTWGDGELQVDMERFLVKNPLKLFGTPYAICELGNYYGYDDFEFGAMRIIRYYLELAGGKELIEPFCMDSLPGKDWAGLARWCNSLNGKLEHRS